MLSIKGGKGVEDIVNTKNHPFLSRTTIFEPALRRRRRKRRTYFHSISPECKVNNEIVLGKKEQQAGGKMTSQSKKHLLLLTGLRLNQRKEKEIKVRERISGLAVLTVQS